MRFHATPAERALPTNDVKLSRKRCTGLCLAIAITHLAKPLIQPDMNPTWLALVLHASTHMLLLGHRFTHTPRQSTSRCQDSTVSWGHAGPCHMSMWHAEAVWCGGGAALRHQNGHLAMQTNCQTNTCSADAYACPANQAWSVVR